MKKMTFLIIAVALTSLIKASAQTLPETNTDDIMKKMAKEMKRKVGIKVGYNVAKILGSANNFSPKNQNGFMVSGFYAPASKGLGYRTELIFSRQGFSFDESGKMQNVSQDYIYMPHFTTFTIAKKVQLQAGGQVGYLLNAKKSPETKTTSGSEQEQQITDFMNRVDYGAAVGVEVYPFKGLIIGGRYNVSMGNIYKKYETMGSTTPTPMPVPYPLPVNPNDFKGRNAVVQFFIGYTF
jgi:hypothetical protein